MLNELSRMVQRLPTWIQDQGFPAVLFACLCVVVLAMFIWSKLDN